MNKPVKYICLMTLENALVTRLAKEMRRRLPTGAPMRWERPIAEGCAVVNIERWNNNFPGWPVRRIPSENET